MLFERLLCTFAAYGFVMLVITIYGFATGTIHACPAH